MPHRSRVLNAGRTPFFITRGGVDRFYMDGESLYADLNIEDPTILPKLPTTIKYVSPEIRGQYKTGDGRVWNGCIAHIALTPLPVFTRQKPFSPAHIPVGAGVDGAALVPLARQLSLVGSLRLSLQDALATTPQIDTDSPKSPLLASASIGDVIERLKQFGLHVKPADSAEQFIQHLSIALYALHGAFTGTSYGEEQEVDDDGDYDLGDEHNDDELSEPDALGGGDGAF